jgi:hypothetical protein
LQLFLKMPLFRNMYLKERSLRFEIQNNYVGINECNVRLEVITVVTMKNVVFWDIKT